MPTLPRTPIALLAELADKGKEIIAGEVRAIEKGERQIRCIDCSLSGGTMVRVGPKGKDAQYRHAPGFCHRRKR